MNKTKFDLIIILGGGITNNGELTDLSIQRLDRGIELYKKSVAKKLLVLGGHKSTYSKNAIYFNETGASIRKKYLAKNGVYESDIYLVEDGRDTIGEAIASKEFINSLKTKCVLLVTSDKHLERSLYVFKNIFGSAYEIEGDGVPCGNLLIKSEEDEYLEETKSFFSKKDNKKVKHNLNTWYEENKELYDLFKRIHDNYHPAGNESQAYMGVKK